MQSTEGMQVPSDLAGAPRAEPESATEPAADASIELGEEVPSESEPVAPTRPGGWWRAGLALVAVILLAALAGPSVASRLGWSFGAVPPSAPAATPLAALEQAVSDSPESDTAHYDLALAYFQAGRFDEAWAQLREVQAYQAALSAQPELAGAEQALQADPTSKEANFKLGTAWTRTQLLPLAEAAFKQAIALDQTYVDAYINLGVVYYQQQRLSEALAEYDKALAVAPNEADVHHNRGAVLTQQALQVSPPDQALLDQAVKEFQRALELNPQLAQAHFSLGVIHNLRDEKEPAIAEFKRFLELDTGSDPLATQEAHRYLTQLGQ
jgi:tetratricopeptide (TPR) repeat protein